MAAVPPAQGEIDPAMLVRIAVEWMFDVLRATARREKMGRDPTRRGADLGYLSVPQIVEKIMKAIQLAVEQISTSSVPRTVG